MVHGAGIVDLYVPLEGAVLTNEGGGLDQSIVAQRLLLGKIALCLARIAGHLLEDLRFELLAYGVENPEKNGGAEPGEQDEQFLLNAKTNRLR